MAIIALNWELGSDFGHIARYVTLAEEFKKQGHRPVMILRDLARAHEIIGLHNIEYYQAPLWMTPIQGLPEPLNLSEMLLRFGFLRPESLISIAQAWRNLWRAIRPDLLLFDHSPSALLAAQSLPQPRILIGNSFSVPALGHPMPCFRWWEKNASFTPRLLEGERRLLQSINAALAALNATTLSRVSQLYDVNLSLILARPELDVYGQRSPIANTFYLPPLNNLDLGVEPHWPAGNMPKVFVYLKPTFRHLEALFHACKQSPANFLIFIAGLPPALCQRFESANIIFSMQPLRMRTIREECDFCISHAGGMTDIMLEAGKPILLFPLNTEQTMTCRQAEQTGAALGFGVDRNPADLTKLLRRLFSDQSLREHAYTYAQRYLHQASDYAAKEMVMKCLSLLKINER